MGFKLALLVISAVAYTAQSAQAPCVCTRNFKPVCGSDGVTYSNECLLNCQRATWGARNDCICPQNYSPVLGPDGVMYPNQCSLNCATSQSSGLELSYYGPCGSTATDSPLEPPCVCGREGKPVCGSDGVTYANDCLLNCATKDNSALSITYFGPCEERVMVVDG